MIIGVPECKYAVPSMCVGGASICILIHTGQLINFFRI